MIDAHTWEWRTFLEDDVPHESFWSAVGVDAVLREKLLHKARLRTDTYIDLGDDSLGLKGRGVDSWGLVGLLELKLRTGSHDHLEEWRKVVRWRPVSSLRLCEAQDARAVLDLLAHAGVSTGAADGRSIPFVERRDDLRLVRIRKQRTRLLLSRDGPRWRATAFRRAAPPDAVLVEHTRLALDEDDPRGLLPLGWTVCCEQRDRHATAEVAELLAAALPGRTMGYPEFIHGLPHSGS